MTPDPAARRAQTELRCYYTDPAKQHLRPNCQQLAVVAYGPITLCASCDRDRSLVGENTAPRPLPAAWLHLVADAAQIKHDADTLLTHTITAARQAGATRAQTANAARLTHQRLQRRHQRLQRRHQHQNP